MAMKHSVARQYFERAWRAAKRFWEKPQPPSTAFDEMQRGSAVGMPACALIAAGMGSSDGMILASGLFGIAAGAVIGFLIWIGADETHEEPVIPPARKRKNGSDIGRGPPSAG